MAETTSSAQFRYLPEDGVFEASVTGFSAEAINAADEQEASRLASRWSCVEILTDIPGVHAVSEEDKTVIWTEPRRLFAGSTSAETQERFLSCLSYILPTYPEDGLDYVVGLEVACHRGVKGVIMSAYDQYQRWLESGKLGDEVLRRALAASLLPLRPELSQAELERSFQYRADGETEHATIGGGSRQVGLSVIRGEFNEFGYLSESGDPDGPWQQTEDVYLLRHVEIRSSAEDSFGVLPAVRQHFMPSSPWLYDMQSGVGCMPHPREIGGYLLAMGILADEASRYSGGRSISDLGMRIETTEAA